MAQMGNVEEVKHLLKVGRSPNESNNRPIAGHPVVHSTPLIHAAWPGHLDVCEVLIHAKADLNHTNLRQNTALHMAYEGGHEAIVRLLIQKGGAKSLKIENAMGKLPTAYASNEFHTRATRGLLHECIMKNGDEESSLLAELLLDAKADPMERGGHESGLFNATPLHVAYKASNMTGAMLLLRRGGVRGMSIREKEGRFPSQLNVDFHEDLVSWAKKEGGEIRKEVDLEHALAALQIKAEEPYEWRTRAHRVVDRGIEEAMRRHDQIWHRIIAHAFKRFDRDLDGFLNKVECLQALMQDDELCVLLELPHRGHMEHDAFQDSMKDAVRYKRHEDIYDTHFNGIKTDKGTRKLNFEEFNEFCTRVHLSKGGLVGSSNSRAKSRRELQGWIYPGAKSAPSRGGHTRRLSIAYPTVDIVGMRSEKIDACDSKTAEKENLLLADMDKTVRVEESMLPRSGVRGLLAVRKAEASHVMFGRDEGANEGIRGIEVGCGGDRRRLCDVRDINKEDLVQDAAPFLGSLYSVDDLNEGQEYHHEDDITELQQNKRGMNMMDLQLGPSGSGVEMKKFSTDKDARTNPSHPLSLGNNRPSRVRNRESYSLRGGSHLLESRSRASLKERSKGGPNTHEEDAEEEGDDPVGYLVSGAGSGAWNGWYSLQPLTTDGVPQYQKGESGKCLYRYSGMWRMSIAEAPTKEAAYVSSRCWQERPPPSGWKQMSRHAMLPAPEMEPLWVSPDDLKEKELARGRSGEASLSLKLKESLIDGHQDTPSGGEVPSGHASLKLSRWLEAHAKDVNEGEVIRQSLVSPAPARYEPNYLDSWAGWRESGGKKVEKKADRDADLGEYDWRNKNSIEDDISIKVSGGLSMRNPVTGTGRWVPLQQSTTNSSSSSRSSAMGHRGKTAPQRQRRKSFSTPLKASSVHGLYDSKAKSISGLTPSVRGSRPQSAMGRASLSLKGRSNDLKHKRPRSALGQGGNLQEWSTANAAKAYPKALPTVDDLQAMASWGH